jgi:hypothetical protein
MKTGRIYAALALPLAFFIFMSSPVGYIRPERQRWADLCSNAFFVVLMSGLFVLVVGAPGLLRTWLRWLSVYTTYVVLLGICLWLVTHYAG